jgi:hypothetical protein
MRSTSTAGEQIAVPRDCGQMTAIPKLINRIISDWAAGSN